MSMRLCLAAVLLATVALAATARAASPVSEYTLQMPAGAKPGDLTAFSPCRYTGLKSRGSDAAECGTLVVAEDRQRPDGRLIALPVVKLPALKPTTLAPIFFFQGGPGQSNFAYTFDAPTLQTEHDIYMLGYRGADDQQPLDCPEVAQAVLAPHPLSDAALAAITAASHACAQRFTAAGVDLARYRMVDVVADNEDLRRALHIERADLLGVSYGTRVEQYYVRLHPRSVLRVAEFSVNPPGHFHWFPEANDALLVAYARACAVACRNLTSDLKASMLATLARTDFAVNGKPLDMDRVRVAAFFQMMDRPSAIRVFAAVLAAQGGDASGLVQLAQGYDAIMPHAFIWGEAVSKAGTDCDPNDATFISERRPTARSLGSPLDLLLFAVCRGWPVQPPPPGFAKPGRDPTPTLLVNGDLDGATPLRYVRDELLPSLPNGALVVLTGEGHDGWVTAQPAAMDRLVSTFLRDGTYDTSLFVFTPPFDGKP